jgi:glycosyltransferase involved in cell wall biosynthesis
VRQVVFVHDHRFEVYGGAVYSNDFPYRILRRYVEVFGHVMVWARQRVVDEMPLTPLALGEGVTFEFFDDISNLRSFFGLRQKMRRQMADRLCGHDALIVRLPSELGMAAADAARRCGKPYLVELVGDAWWPMWYYGGYRAKCYAPWFFLRVQQTVRYAQQVNYVTQAYLQKRYPADSKVVVSAVSDVELPEFSQAVLQKRLQKIWDHSDPWVFGTIASLEVGYKGVDVALRALSELKEEGYDFVYQIVGEGDPSYYRALSNSLGLGDSVDFLGTLKFGKAVYDWIDQLDLYLQPSHTEGLPRAMVEAMSRGCPIVASSVGGIPELLGPAYRFDRGDSKGMLACIKRVLSKAPHLDRVATRNVAVSRAYDRVTLEIKRRQFLAYFQDQISR